MNALLEQEVYSVDKDGITVRLKGGEPGGKLFWRCFESVTINGPWYLPKTTYKLAGGEHQTRLAERRIAVLHHTGLLITIPQEAILRYNYARYESSWPW